ncbi:hypothetical protein [Hydrogenophaga sp. BPS33]|uniref:hypothetical protein n=1 Tax=Hydrogenophaga sp. BPS33 TaxID=2651974 RepID=UPI00131F5DFC|nr:hypothetical protein [Hydrogenophaga sp. BPS33]QHE85179.1 hypothetical protein F9K07_09910 [Hydrogenophaga sp. BPS33]
MPITNEPVPSLVSKFFKTDKKSKATGKNEKTGVSNSSKPNPPRTEKEKKEKPTQKLETHRIKVSEPGKQKRAEALADAQLREVLRALLQGKPGDARSTMEGISKSLQKTAKNSPDPDAVVRDFCRKSLTPDLAVLPNDAITDMAHHAAKLLAKNPNDPVFAQVNFSIKSELLARAVRALVGQGIDPARGDTDGLSSLHETQLQTLRDMAREVAGMAKGVASWRDELAAKQLPWDGLQHLRKWADQACTNLQAQRQKALVLVATGTLTTISNLSPAALTQWVHAIDVLACSNPHNPGDRAEKYLLSNGFKVLKQEIADAEQAIVDGLNLGDLKTFDAEALPDQRLADLHGAMARLAHVPRSIQQACNETHIAMARRSLQRLDVKTSSVADVEALIAFVVALLPGAKSQKDISDLKTISHGLMKLAVAKSALAIDAYAAAEAEVGKSAASVAMAVNRAAAADTAVGDTKRKTKARTKADDDTAEAASALQAAKAEAQRVAKRESAAKQAAAHAKKVATQAVQVADRVTAAWAKAHPQVQTTQTL